MRSSPLRAAARGARRFGLPLLTIPAALALHAGAAQAASGTVETRYMTLSGCLNRFVVPAGVTRLDVVVAGDSGGGDNGGLGAEVSGRISVTPGQTLYGCVSEGGAAGGNGVIYDGFGGGGYALLSRFEDLSSPYAIAGGGGGAGGNEPNGGSGGNAGLPGDDARDGISMGIGGAGGGRGASSGGAGSAGINSDSSSANGRAGTIRRGGAGGAGDVAGGGGGGGGVWGGGGGAGSVEVGNGAGGGGGTSYCDMGASCYAQLTVRGGYIALSYEVPDRATTTTAAVSEATPNHSAPITYTATVSPVPAGGTVRFEVGDWEVWGCGSVPVDTTTGVATCNANAPYEPGPQTLTTSYSGVVGWDSSSDDEQFRVLSGAVSISPSPSFAYGDVELGAGKGQTFTVTNSGDGPLEIDALDGIYVSEYEPYAMPPRSADFVATDDQCSDRTLAPNGTCTVTVAFKPIALGERTAELMVFSDAWDGGDPVRLTGVGIAPQPKPEPRPEPTPDPTPTPQPTPGPTPTPTPAAPAAPQAPVTPPAASARTPSTPPVGATSPLKAATPAPVSQSGSFRLPLVCPPGQACRVSGTLTLSLTGGQARASQASKTRVLVRFSGVRIAAGTTKSLSLRLPAAFVKAQQKQGVRKLRTTLTVRTTLGSGQTVTRRQAVTILIPRARAAQRAAPAPAPRAAPRRPAFTG